jgi:hypothetical protein
MTSWRRQLTSIVALLLAATATIATSPGPGPGVSASETFEVALSSARPYDVRQVTISFSHGGHDPNSVWLSFFQQDLDPSSHWVAVIPQASEEPVESWTETMTYEYENRSFDLTDWCEEDCERTYLVVIGLAAGVETLEAEFEASVSSAYDVEQGNPLAGATASIVVSQNEGDALGMVDLRGHATGQLIIGPGDEPVWRGTLHLTGAPEVKQGVGLLELQLDGTMSDSKANADVAINVNGAYILIESVYRERLADLVTVEWLEACQGTSDCDIPIELETTWDPYPESAGSVAQTGSVTINFTIDARLVFIGQSTVPADASLELLTQ